MAVARARLLQQDADRLSGKSMNDEIDRLIREEVSGYRVSGHAYSFTPCAGFLTRVRRSTSLLRNAG